MSLDELSVVSGFSGSHILEKTRKSIDPPEFPEQLADDCLRRRYSSSGLETRVIVVLTVTSLTGDPLRLQPLSRERSNVLKKN